VDAGERQEFGNPLRLRAALEAGARVIIAHCASLGESVDLDAPESGGVRVRCSSFDLFARLMEEQLQADAMRGASRRGRLWGDLSAVTFRNRNAGVLHELLRRSEWHARLVYGSDWPLPAIRIMTDLHALQAAGLLRAEDVPLLEELQAYHPLLFDLVLKRQLRGAGDARFADEVFLARAEVAAW
jgi:mannonate dehydratase